MNYKNLLLSFLISFALVLIVSHVSTASTFIQNENTQLYMYASEREAQMLSSMIVTKDNHVIVIDGGWDYDAERLATKIKCYGGVVDAWLITHADPDHIGALYRIMQDGYDIKIKSIYCSLASDEWYKKYSPDTSYFVFLFRKSIENYHFVSTKKNDIIKVGTSKIIVLNDRYEFDENSVNNSSIVYKVIVDDTSILYLGDLGYEGGEKLLAETPPYLLSSDIVQMSHHGQAGVGEDVYKAIDPKIALWSTPQWLWINQNGKGKYKTQETRQWMQEIGCKNYVTADGDICLKLE